MFNLTKHKENAGQHPDFDGGQSLGLMLDKSRKVHNCFMFNLGWVCGDIVEDVDQHQEEGYEERHATWDVIIFMLLDTTPPLITIIINIPECL